VVDHEGERHAAPMIGSQAANRGFLGVPQRDADRQRARR
jgi:hypothetical protein